MELQLYSVTFFYFDVWLYRIFTSTVAISLSSSNLGRYMFFQLCSFGLPNKVLTL